MEGYYIILDMLRDYFNYLVDVEGCRDGVCYF